MRCKKGKEERDGKKGEENKLGGGREEKDKRPKISFKSILNCIC